MKNIPPAPCYHFPFTNGTDRAAERKPSAPVPRQKKQKHEEETGKRFSSAMHFFPVPQLTTEITDDVQGRGPGVALHSHLSEGGWQGLQLVLATLLPVQEHYEFFNQLFGH
ncbi:hypothetical protein EYF80_043950 [Liparis tanakae]|uniref:Uncharacterized protein n=1 Tax=Liparis tanakae TaxID=230148 RepID=A0A4Z2FZS8_9TELE|nr:hypothetical protein EYF80_043950 [Liparis tanakae]